MNHDLPNGIKIGESAKPSNALIPTYIHQGYTFEWLIQTP